MKLPWIRKVVLPMVAVICTPLGAAEFVDHFDFFNQDHWTEEFSGIRMIEEPFPTGVKIKDGVCLFHDPGAGSRLTSRQYFLYGTFEARVKIPPRGLQYIGFMSRQPWGANSLFCMSLKDGSGWRVAVSRDTPMQGVGIEINQGIDVGIRMDVAEGSWCTIKIAWQKDKISVYADGKLKGVVSDTALIPQKPIELIIDQVVGFPIEVDYIKVSGTTLADQARGQAPALSAEGSVRSLENKHWKVLVDESSGLVREIHQLQPTPRLWTPAGKAGIDIYFRNLSQNRISRFAQSRDGHFQSDRSFRCSNMSAEEPAWKDLVRAGYEVTLAGQRLRINATFTAIQDINEPVEIGLGLPFTAADWKRQIFARWAWLAISPRQSSRIRFPFLADPDDATIPSNVGGWIFYPFGILDGPDRMVLWGNMDLGRRMVLAPNNYESVPATTLAPKRWAKGEIKTLQLTLKSFTKPKSGFPQVLRWYLSNCHSSDPLTRDLFPVRDWTPRTFNKPGGVGMVESVWSGTTDSGESITGKQIIPSILLASQTDPERFRKVTDLLKEYSLGNLWTKRFQKIDGSYPITGDWYNVIGLKISASQWKYGIQKLQEAGLRPCMYFFQFLIPEVLKDGGIPDKRWILHGTNGTLCAFDSYAAGEGYYTKELGEELGATHFTWACADYGNKDFRKWYLDSVKAVIDHYQPSGISFDYGWSIMNPHAAWSEADRATSLPHARLQVQAELYRWMKEKYPHMDVITNCIPGSPSQFFADCMLLEHSEWMSDLDFLAGKALGAAMSSMDYFSDHDRARWTRQMMLDLARGCSFGAPTWILTTPPESEYIATWKSFLKFSGRTTVLPHNPRADAVRSLRGSRNIVGTVWTDGQDFMAAVFDRREEGQVIDTTISIAAPPTLPADTMWFIAHLNQLNVEITGSRWSITALTGKELVLTGPLGPGEMILVDNGQKD